MSPHALARAVCRSALVVVPGVAVVTASGARADEPLQELVRLEYQSSDGCPDRASFEARVRARTVRVLFVGSNDPTRTFVVGLTYGPPAHGRLTVRHRDVVEGTREVSADACSDVADALALAVALAIDPDSLVAAPLDVGSPTAEPAIPPPAAASPPLVRSATQGPPAPVVSGRTPAMSEAPPGRTSLPHTLSMGADLAIATGISPVALVGISPRLGWRAQSTSLLAPSASLAFFRSSSGALSVPVGAASFEWTVGQIDGCLVSWRRGPARFLGCARIEAGDLDATGSDGTPPLTRHRAWFAVGPLGRGEWDLLPPLFLAVEAAAMVHATAERFFFLPSVTIYEVPVLGFRGLRRAGSPLSLIDLDRAGHPSRSARMR